MKKIFKLILLITCLSFIVFIFLKFNEQRRKTLVQKEVLDEKSESLTHENQHQSQTLHLNSDKNSKSSQDSLSSESENSRNTQKQTTPNPSDYYEGLRIILDENISTSGLNTGLSRCLTSESKINLKRDIPLSFDEISESCAKNFKLNKENTSKLSSIFRQSISSSQKDISLDAWYECVSKKKIDMNACGNEKFSQLIDGFYDSTKGEKNLKNSDFQEKWAGAVHTMNSEVIRDCPEDTNLLTEMYAHECINGISN